MKSILLFDVLEMKKINQILERHADKFEVIGLLGNNDHKRSQYSDYDLYLLMVDGKPSTYCQTCEELCIDIFKNLKNAFVFASFKQQILLKYIIQKKKIYSIHYLQYLNQDHFLYRETNNLPLKLNYILNSIGINNPEIFKKITKKYNDPNFYKKPKLIRYYYYLDVLNELIPLFFNYNNNIIPVDLLIQEAIHKIKFVVKNFLTELISKSPCFSYDLSTAQKDELLIQMNYEKWIEIADEIEKLKNENPSIIEIEQLAFLIKKIYLEFDRIQNSFDY